MKEENLNDFEYPHEDYLVGIANCESAFYYLGKDSLVTELETISIEITNGVTMEVIDKREINLGGKISGLPE